MPKADPTKLYPFFPWLPDRSARQTMLISEPDMYRLKFTARSKPTIVTDHISGKSYRIQGVKHDSLLVGEA
jgi:hypothetical protein